LKIVTEIQIEMSKAKGKYSAFAGVLGTVGGALMMVIAHAFGWL
jgi:hypothetical protein